MSSSYIATGEGLVWLIGAMVCLLCGPAKTPKWVVKLLRVLACMAHDVVRMSKEIFTVLHRSAHSFHLPVSQPSTSIIIENVVRTTQRPDRRRGSRRCCLGNAACCRLLPSSSLDTTSRQFARTRCRQSGPSCAAPTLPQNPRLMRARWLTLKSLSLTKRRRRRRHVVEVVFTCPHRDGLSFSGNGGQTQG